MYSPVTIGEIGEFIQSLFTAFGGVLALAFTLMLTFSILFGIKNLLVGDFR